MVKLAKRLTKAFSNGIVLGTIFYLVGSVAQTIIPALPVLTGVASFIVGFGGAIGIALSEDVN